jgi:maleylacetoacetate isomerase
VRIALALKGLSYDYEPVDIREGEQYAAPYLDGVNASPSVPAFVSGDFHVGQSLAIIDYLDGIYPEPRLIPLDSMLRARVLELSYAIACDIHPVNNLRVLRYLQDVLHVSPTEKSAWYRHWVDEGLQVVERLLERYGHGPWCFGDAPTLADCCLVPQIANAKRMGCDTDRFPHAMAVYTYASKHTAFQHAQPQSQPDFTG